MSANAVTILAICFLAAVHGMTTVPTPAVDVSNLCDAATCTGYTVCRAVQATVEGTPAATCLSCVPAGLDATCRANNFANTVLVGDASNLAALACVEGNCPAGSSCQVGAEGNGVCCYGEVAVGALPAERWCN